MARMRFTHSSLTSGYINKSACGNVDSERYNNSLTECTNFYISESGGCFKRPGTTFVWKIGGAEAECEYEKIICCNEKLFVFANKAIWRIGLSKPCGSLALQAVVERYKDRQNDVPKITHDTRYCFLESDKVLFAAEDGLYEIVLSKSSSNNQGFKKFDFIYPPMTFPDTSFGLLIRLNTEAMISFKEVCKVNSQVLCDNIMINPKNIVPSGSDVIKKAEKVSVVLDEKRFLLQQNGDNQWQLIGYLSDALSLKGCLIYVNDNKTAPSKEWHKRSSQKDRQYIPALTWNIDIFHNVEHKYKIPTVYEGRLFLANIGNYSTGVWASSLSGKQFQHFDIGIGDVTDGIQFKINTKYADEILWFAPHTKLIAGARSGIYAIGAMSFNDEAIAPANCRAKLLSSVGASSLQPVSGLDAIFFVDSSGKAVYEIALGQDGGILQVNPLSTLASDLIETKIVAHCWQQNPNKIYWCVLEDGSLRSMTFSRNANIVAWAKHEIAGGKVIDICTATIEEIERVCLVVKRDGGVYIEYLNDSFEMKSNINANHAVYLDCSKTFSIKDFKNAEAPIIIAGLEHLNDEEVSVCLDNNFVEKHTVRNNKIVLRHSFKDNCTVGLSYKSTLQTVPLSGGSVLGSSIGSVGSQKNVVLHLYNSLGGKYGADAHTMYSIPYIQKEIKFDTAHPMFTGLIKAPLINSYDVYNRSIRIEHDDPTSFNILSIVQDISISDS